MEEELFNEREKKLHLDGIKAVDGCLDKFIFILFIGILIFVLFSLQSCQSIKYVPVETVKTEYVTNTVHDSIYIQAEKNDCTIIITRNDTVFHDRWRTIYKDRWRERLVSDTLVITDSIQVPYPVEKQLTKWQKMKMNAGGVSLIMCIIFVVSAIILIFIKGKKL